MRRLCHQVQFQAMKNSPADFVVATVVGLVAAVLAGVAGFLAGIFACSKSGEAGETALVVAPATALIFAVLAFAFTFRWIMKYGDVPSN